MQTVNAAELAKQLNLTPGRISQLAKEGRLDGCYTGDGRSRRYDPALVAKKLRGTLDPGQGLGNGAKTREAIGHILNGGQIEAPQAPKAPPRTDSRSPDGDDDTYKLQREALLAEQVRRARRQNELEEGTLVLASEVERQVARVLRQEIAEVEEMLRTAARAIADRLGVDFRATKQILTETWRNQRQTRSGALEEQAAVATMTEAEKEQDI